MWRCPVCEKEHIQGSVCDDCGFDSSCDYEQNQTLCPALPKRIEPISVRAAKRRQQQKQTVAVSPDGSIQIKFCANCGEEIKGYPCLHCGFDAGALPQPGPEPEREPESMPTPKRKSKFWQNPYVRIAAAFCAAVVLMVVISEWMQSGEAGPSVTWKLNRGGVMTISGSGEMYDYAASTKRPWGDRKDKITSVVVEPGVTRIGNYAFWGCHSLTSVTLPEGVTEIGDSSFLCCLDLTSISLPKGMTKIGNSAFLGCHSLTNITLPEGVTEIDSSVFFGCSSLASITLPESVIKIGLCAFGDCTSLADVYYGGTEEQWRSIEISGGNDDLLIATVHFSSAEPAPAPENVIASGEAGPSVTWALDSEGVLTISGSGEMYSDDPPWESHKDQITSVVVEHGVTEIGRWAFANCFNLTSIALPEGITEIGYSAFGWCSSLTSITLPKGVTVIGYGAFRECYNLTSITLPEGVAQIGYNTFEWCTSLTSITLPKEVAEIGYGAFETCTSLTDIYYGGTKEQWQRIEIHSDNNNLLNATIHYNS